jgi:hypothetical protein
VAPQPVEWVLVVHYGTAAHQAVYGRQVKQSGSAKGAYTKDYIQLSRKQKFLDEIKKLFSIGTGHGASVALTYKWPKGTALGEIAWSADRHHLKWGTTDRAPQVWKMAPTPSDATPETLPGDPSHLKFVDAENEFKQLASHGAGQPYLMAIKLRDQPKTLHLRAYLAEPNKSFSWADLKLVPKEVQALAAKTSKHSATASSLFSGLGLLFDPTLNHDAWSRTTSNSSRLASNGVPAALSDAVAETLEVDPKQVEDFSEKIESHNYEVPDTTATVKIRGSAQKAFADKVKKNYGYRCAITGIATKEFLIASHIVPWGQDQSIRLDPSNGICLSLLVDCAFEKGYLTIKDDLTVLIDWDKVGADQTLKGVLKPYDKQKLSKPHKSAPKPEYLRRRRKLIAKPV